MIASMMMVVMVVYRDRLWSLALHCTLQQWEEARTDYMYIPPHNSVCVGLAKTVLWESKHSVIES